MSTDPTGPTDGRLVLLGSPGHTDSSPTTIGAKAADLDRLACAGLAVPPGFVLTTQVCRDYHSSSGHLDPDVDQLLRRGIAFLERATGRRFGAARRPLLLSVRSGAAVSMPGMLETILNVGLTDASLPGLLLATGDPAFVWDCYRRLIQAFAETVEGLAIEPFESATAQALNRQGVPDLAELDVSGRRALVGQLQGIYQSMTKRPFPQEPEEQLLLAVEGVLRSWNSERAVEYRRLEGLSDLTGTAVTVQTMVFGNLGVASGAGVAFTRNPATGEDELYVDFLLNAQGEDVVAGHRTIPEPTQLIDAVPGLAQQLQTARHRLETLFGDAQDFEFTLEEGRLWLLQTRTAKRTPLAALQIACDLVQEGIIDRTTALERLSSYDIDHITTTRLDATSGTEPIGRATSASVGIASGLMMLDADSVFKAAAAGHPVILVREHASTTDIAALAASRGLLTATGARTSHAAVVARQLGVVCLTSCTDLEIDPHNHTARFGPHQLAEGDTITLDATSGNIYQGALQATRQAPTDLIDRVKTWRSQTSSHS